MKKFKSKIFELLFLISYLLFTNLFYVSFGNKVDLIGFNIINLIFLLISFICYLIVNFEFKKYKHFETDTPKEFIGKIFNSVYNSFAITTIFSSLIAILLLIFLKTFLLKSNLNYGIINYTIYSLKIFFVTSPFWGLEIAIFKYIKTLNCYPVFYIKLFQKLILFIFLTFLLFFKYRLSAILYAKLISDLIFLIYHSNTLFRIARIKSK